MSKIIRHTSANVDGRFYYEIVKAAEKFNRREEAIFKDLIELVIHAVRCGQISGILTEYQDHSPESWELLHYSLDEDEIEVYGKARQVYKISISKLAFVGFLFFWPLLMLKYAEKLEKPISKIFFDSYEEYRKLLLEFKIYFKKRLCLILKE